MNMVNDSCYSCDSCYHCDYCDSCYSCENLVNGFMCFGLKFDKKDNTKYWVFNQEVTKREYEKARYKRDINYKKVANIWSY